MPQNSLGLSIMMTLAATWSAFATAMAAEVTVVTTRNRALTAEVDIRTDDDALWLRFVSPRIVLRRSIAWDQIATAHIGETEMTADELKEQARDLATDLPEDHFETADQPGNRYHPPARPRRVHSLLAWAEPASWDRDAEIDGLVLRLAALDENGDALAVRGQLYATLIGRDNSPTSREKPFPTLQRWSMPIQTHDIRGEAGTYQLPFRTVHPDLDPGLSTNGMLRITLTAFQHGSFQTEIPVRTRDYNPIRDQMLLYR